MKMKIKVIGRKSSKKSLSNVNLVYLGGEGGKAFRREKNLSKKY